MVRALAIASVVSFASGCGSGVITDSSGDEPGVGADGGPGNSADPLDGGGTVPPDPDATPVPGDDTAAAGVAVDRIAVYQSVEIEIAANGSPIGSRNATVVAGADALFGVFVDVEPGYSPRQIKATVVIDGAPFSETKMISSASSGDNPRSSGFAIKVDGPAITASSQYHVLLSEISSGSYSGSTAGARFPAAGTTPLGAESSNGPLELVIVPFQYNADGSGRLPPVDDGAIESYRRAFLAMYPVPEVNITVHAPIPYTGSIGASNSGQWQRWLETLADLRASESPSSNVYYYGVAAPANSIGNFCGFGCILGLGYVPGASNSFLFASVGVSFSGSVGLGTALHEVGHTMGRSHSPCGGVSGADPSYPYSGAKIGVWGYDSSSDQLKDPNVGTDIMGYCSDQWISDYTYEAIYNRVRQVNASALALVSGAVQRYRVARVDDAGNVHWRQPIELAVAPVGGEREVAFVGAGGGELERVTGHFFPYDHVGGGKLLVPEPAAAPAAVRIDGIARDIAW